LNARASLLIAAIEVLCQDCRDAALRRRGLEGKAPVLNA
jgi:hypothetical protein